MIKVGSFHQLMTQTWQIFTTEGLGPGRAIVCIFHKPRLRDSYYRGFKNTNENISLEFQTECDKVLSDPIRSRIMYFYILLFSYVPGLYFVSSRMC